MATLRKTIKAGTKKGNTTVLRIKEIEHTLLLGLLWQLEVVMKPDGSPVGNGRSGIWWMTAQGCCQTPFWLHWPGKVLPREEWPSPQQRWRLPPGPLHTCLPPPPFLSPLTSPRIHNPPAAWVPYCVRTRRKAAQDTKRNENEAEGYWGTSRFLLSKGWNRKPVVPAERGQIVYLVRLAGTSGHILLETSILCPCDAEATDTPGQDRTGLPGVRSGACETTQEPANQHSRDFLFFVFEEACVSQQSTTDRGGAVNWMNHSTDWGWGWWGGDVLVVNHIYWVLLIAAVFKETWLRHTVSEAT